MHSYFDALWSNYDCGVKKRHISQQYLLPMIKNCRKNFDNNAVCAELLTDLIMVFDCLPHDFFIVKPHAYGC